MMTLIAKHQQTGQCNRHVIGFRCGEKNEQMKIHPDEELERMYNKKKTIIMKKGRGKKIKRKVQSETAWEISTTPQRNAIRHHHTLPVTLTEVLCHCGQLEQMDGQQRHLIGTGDNKPSKMAVGERI
ncbi:hypothetical protein AVEN_143238-1 [Araneus ventricosus]|uniref:Uncharacterized protein n=1 Tax=Araneus ventricosus TaxID=182803 RepID=A0A4Y2AG27_ARAVE|nr:hypothetical protein AVEN_143238-1 [Araneus ventricosus]